LVTIDSIPILNMNLGEVAKLMIGQHGSSVRLGLRTAVGELKVVVLKRESVEIARQSAFISSHSSAHGAIISAGHFVERKLPEVRAQEPAGRARPCMAWLTGTRVCFGNSAVLPRIDEDQAFPLGPTAPKKTKRPGPRHSSPT